MTKRAAVFLTAVFLATIGCERVQSDPYDPPSTRSFNVLYNLAGEGFGDSYGTLRITSDGEAGEVCWGLTFEQLPKAVQLHKDVTGPSDPVVSSLYEPPDEPSASGCRSLDEEIARQVREGPEGFYVDGHNNDRDPKPVIWAALTRDG